jgi:hypothetical protein
MIYSFDLRYDSLKKKWSIISTNMKKDKTVTDHVKLDEKTHQAIAKVENGVIKIEVKEK